MRAQLDTAVSMVLTLFIIGVVLTLAVFGFVQLEKQSKAQGLDSFFSSLSADSSSFVSAGSQNAQRVAAPSEFCVFNTTATDKTCIPDQNGYAICERFKAYWTTASAGGGNVWLASGENRRVPGLVPENGRFACFSSGQPTVFFSGRGKAVAVSPMRKLETYGLHEAGGGSNSISMRTFTSSATSNIPELILFDTGSSPADSYTTSSSATIPLDASGTEITQLTVSLDTSGSLSVLSVLPSSLGNQPFSTHDIGAPQLQYD